MNTTNAEDVLNFGEENKPTLPQGLNVLTILTFVGCGFGFLWTLIMPFLMKFFLKIMDNGASMNQDISAKQLEDIRKGKEAIVLYQENVVVLTIGHL